MDIYQPAEDSFLLQKLLKKEIPNLFKKNPNLKFLDIGTGSGILAKTALEFLPPKNITALDINKEAIKNLKNQPFKTIHSNLFEALSSTQPPNHPTTQPPKKIKFDLIVFNAPYLPKDKREPKSSRLATTGGKKGDEISLKFLKQAKPHLTPNGKILLLISSLTPTNKIKSLWPYKIVATKKIFMEKLQILEFKNP